MSDDDWHNQECRTISRFSQRNFSDGSKNALLLVVHGAESTAEIQLPVIDGVEKYELLWNSAHESPHQEAVTLLPESEMQLSGTSMLLFRAI